MNRSVMAKQLTFGWLHFALALPSIYLLLGMPLVLREQGWSGTQIGLLQLAGLPAILKLVMAVPVERCRLAGGGYRAWACLLGLLLGLALLGLAYDFPLAQPPRFYAWVLLISLLATWADVPVNALAIRCLPAEERLRAGSIRSAALFLAAVVGGGLLLVLHQRTGGAVPFVLMALLLAVGGILLCGMVVTAQPENEPHIPAEAHFSPPYQSGVLNFFLSARRRCLGGVVDAALPFRRRRLDLPQTADARPWHASGAGCLVGGGRRWNGRRPG